VFALGLGLIAVAAFLVFFVIRFDAEIRGILGRGLKVQQGRTQIVIPGERLSEAVAEGTFVKESSVESSEPPPEPKQLAPPKTAEDWVVEMYDAFFGERDPKKLDEAFKKFQETEQDADKKLQQEAFYYFLKYECGDTSALEKLHRLSEIPNAAWDAYFWIGRCHEEGGDLERALQGYDAALKHSGSDRNKVSAVGAIARCLFKRGQTEAAYREIIEHIPTITQFNAKSELYESLGGLYERAKNWEMRAAALEKALEFRPNDTTNRFNAAFSYSSSQLNALSYSHYRRLLTFNPKDAAAQNNLGVEAETLKMPLRSVTHYKEASTQGNTLADANLGYRLINAGFEEEATAILDRAKGQKEMHPNVGSAIAALAKSREYEKNRDQELATTATAQQQYLLRFGDAAFSGIRDPAVFEGQWFSSEGYFIKIAVQPNNLEAHWQVDKRKFKFAGKTSNHAATLDFFVWSYDYQAGSFDWRFVPDGKGYAYYDSDKQMIFIFKFKGEVYSFLTLSRLVLDPAKAETPQLMESAKPALPSSST